MHGAKIYRNGEVVGFKKPLERLAVREVSSRYLSQEERLLIADLHLAGPYAAGHRQTVGALAVDDLP